jgi:hypothetical protein
MNWFASQPVSADSMIQAGLPYLEVFCALVGIMAVLMLLIALLYPIFAVRSSNSYPELNRFGETKQRVDPTPAARRKLLRVAHFRG